MKASRLLVIDADEANCALIQDVAELVSYEVKTTSDESAFKHQVAQFEPHVVVIDLIMPEVDGYDLIKFLTQSKMQVHLVIMSGQDPVHLEASEMLARDWGISSVTIMRKPFDVARFGALLQTFQIKDALS